MSQNAFPEIEEEVLEFWQKQHIFKKCLEKKSRGDFVFYDGPPFATGLPHYGHIIASAIKDVIPRYKTMHGFRVNRRWGWDCHGLPIENLIEKELGLNTKKDIEKLGIDKFNQACRDSVLRYADEWKKFIPRMARWVDMENDYRTMDNRYIEVIWWIFKELHKDGLIYEGYKSIHLCPRCETTLSNFEVTLGYKEVKDLAVTVKFRIKNYELRIKNLIPNIQYPISNIYFLAWTTTPWTLPGNMALAVGEGIKYQIINLKSQNSPADSAGKTTTQNSNLQNKQEYYILAKDRIKEVMKDKDYEIIGELKGKDLVSLEYEPLFNLKSKILNLKSISNAFKAYPANFVSTKDGTGIVHIAPAFGEDDYQLSQKFNIPLIQHINKNGTVKTDIVKLLNCYIVKNQQVQSEKKRQFNNLTIEQLNKLVVEILEDSKILFQKEFLKHSYPHCWRCDTPLLNYATSSWFVKIDDDFKKRLLCANSKVNWVPPHLKDGRFGKWLEGARDWAISRSRYWGAPIPVWKCQKCQNIKAIGSIKEFLKNKTSDRKPEILTSSKDLVHSSVRNAWHRDNIIKHNKKSVKRKENNLPAEGLAPSKDSMSSVPLHYAADILPLYQNYQSQAIDLHRPFIDEIKLQCDKCQSDMKRIPEVFDCWFESGSMPYASALSRLDADLGDADKTQILDLSQMSRKDLLKHIEFPADFIAEGIDQTRGWFYTLLVLGVGLYNQSPFKNVVVNGIILAEDGQKMSKRLKNYPDPMSIIDKYGADAMRFYLLSSPAVRGETLNFSEKEVDGVYKKVVLLVLNVLRFWKQYADQMSNVKCLPAIASKAKQAGQMSNQIQMSNVENILDQWILAKLQQLIDEVEKSLDNYEIDKACRPIVDFVNDLSTWYLRRSRERFKEENQPRKISGQTSKCRNTAVKVLGYVLLEFSKVLAPICPFLAEHIYQNVKCQSPNVKSMSNVKVQMSNQWKESVHLEDWPGANYELRITNYELLENMKKVRQICEIGHSLRDQAGVKVRQALRQFKIQNSKFKIKNTALQLYSFTALVQDELNVKEVEIVDKLPQGDGWIIKDSAALYIVIDEELKENGIVRELTRQINNLRKKQGLTIRDQVVLEYATESEQLSWVMKKYQNNLKQAVLAKTVNCQKNLEGEKIKIEAEEIIVKLNKL